MKKIKYIFAVLGLSLALTGCEHALSETSVIEPLETASNEKSITISGTINSSGATSRTATSSFDGDITWIITAYSTDNSGKSASGRSVSRNFTLECPVAGTWLIMVLGYPGYHPDGSVGSTEAIFSGTQSNITVTDEGLESPLQITATPLSALRNPNSEVAGSISLDISSESADVKKVQAKLKAYPSGTETIQASASFSDGEATLSIDDIAPGSYVARLFFEDNDGNNLYACTEMINVYSGMETNVWYGTAPYLIPEEGGITRFELTGALISSFGSEITISTDYVLYTKVKMGDEGSGETPYYIEKLYKGDSLSNITADDFIIGEQGWTRIKSDFDSEGNVYTLFQKESGSYKGFVLYRNNTVLLNLEPASEDTFYFKSFSIDRKTDNFYFSRIIRENYGDQSYVLYKCPESDLNSFIDSIDNKDFTISGVSDYVIANNKFTVFENIMYIVSGSSLKVIELSDIPDSTGDTKPELSSSKVQTYSYSGTFGTITDIIYQDKAVYILNQKFEGNTNMNQEGKGLTIKRQSSLVKFSTVLKKFATLGWNETPLETEGKWLYTSGMDSYDVLNYQYFTDESHTSHVLMKADDITTSNFELYYPVSEGGNLSTTSFYGPQSFVAIKPKQLVIADDGLAVYTDAYGFFRCKNVNRVVYVDLEEFAITDTKEFSDTIEFAGQYSQFPISLCTFSWGPENLYDENHELFYSREDTPGDTTIYYQEENSTTHELEDKSKALSFGSLIVNIPLDTE